MAPRPFPYPLSIGTDILHLPRLHRLLTVGPRTSQSNGNPTEAPIYSFVRRILSRDEIATLDRAHPGWKYFNRSGEKSIRAGTQGRKEFSGNTVDEDGIVRWLGGRWAVKEAARKAVGAERCGWKDVWVRVQEGGRVECVVKVKDTGEASTTSKNAGRVREEELEGDQKVTRLDEDEGRVARCSISHDGEYVTAVVLAVEDGATATERQRDEGTLSMAT